MLLKDDSPRSMTGIAQVIAIFKHLQYRAERKLCCGLTRLHVRTK